MSYSSKKSFERENGECTIGTKIASVISLIAALNQHLMIPFKIEYVQIRQQKPSF